MTAQQPDDGPLSRRSFVHGALMTTVVAALVPAGLVAPLSARAHGDGAIEELFRQLDRKILDAMEEFAIPGVAVGVLHRGREYVRGFGVTDVGNQRPVDADTVFRIASTSKTFTGTTAMRLVDTGRLDLDLPIRRYITNFRPPEGAEGVTVRQLLNHSAGSATTTMIPARTTARSPGMSRTSTACRN